MAKSKGKQQTDKSGGQKAEMPVKLGKVDEDGFAPVLDPEGGETFQFMAAGDECEGIYFDSFVNTGGEYGDSNCYKVFDPNSQRIQLCWGTFVLDKFMKPLRPGSYVKITYKGKAGRAHNFKVGVSEKLTRDHAALARELLAKAAARRAASEDNPF